MTTPTLKEGDLLIETGIGARRVLVLARKRRWSVGLFAVLTPRIGGPSRTHYQSRSAS